MADDKLNEVIQLTITRETQGVSEAGFGAALLIGDKANTNDEGFPVAPARVKVYNFVDWDTALVADGYTDTRAIYKACSAYFSQNPAPTQIYVGYRDSAGGEDWGAALSAIKLVNNDWWAILCTNRTDEAAGGAFKCAEWAQTKGKMFVGASNDATIYDPAGVLDIAFLFHNANYERAAVLYAGEADTTTDVKGWADAALCGKCLPYTPGSETWAFKGLTGINPDNTLLSADRTAAWAKSAMIYDTLGGVNGTRAGEHGNAGKEGNWIDVIRLCDWITARIQERVYGKLALLAKVPFTDQGAALVANEIRSVLNEGVTNGGLASIVSVSVPKIADVSTAKKAARTLPSVTFRAILAGAIHKVEIAGTVAL
jgi:hypothetical protein